MGPLPCQPFDSQSLACWSAALQELSEQHWDLFGRGRQENPLEGLRDLLLSVTVDEGDASHGGDAAGAAGTTGAPPHSNGSGGGGGAAGVQQSVVQRSVLSSSSGSFSDDRR